MHCNSERRILDCLYRLRGDLTCLSSLKGLLAAGPFEAELKPFLLEFLALASIDPYGPYPSEAPPGVLPPTGVDSEVWIDSLVETCRQHDREFTIALEESLRVRFEKAGALFWK
jgi:hypothetical protein